MNKVRDILLVRIKKTAIANSRIQLKFFRNSNDEKQLVTLIGKLYKAKTVKKKRLITLDNYNFDQD